MDFVEIDILCSGDLKDILTAELGQLGYDSFLETSHGLRAYQPMDHHNPDIVSQLLERYMPDTGFESRKISERNWNEIWEKSFEPIEIVGKCRIRASFHQAESAFPFEIIIDPKMSFGTGHHETTRQVLRFQLELNHYGKSVLDVGCGTGVLSILAEKKGAETVVAIDNDPRAVNSAIDNAQLNGCTGISIKEGTVADLPDNSIFDLIFANINKNVLLDEIYLYQQHLHDGGRLILSGFYTCDTPEVVKTCEDNAFKIKSLTEENQWACLLLGKTN